MSELNLCYILTHQVLNPVFGFYLERYTEDKVARLTDICMVYFSHAIGEAEILVDGGGLREQLSDRQRGEGWTHSGEFHQAYAF